MIQKTYHIKNCTPESFQSTLKEVAATAEYIGSAQTLILMLEQNWDIDRIREKTSMIRHALPKAEVAGVTHFDSILYAPDGTGLEQGTQENTVLSFLFFEYPAFTIETFALKTAVAEEIKVRLDKTPFQKCVLTFFSGAPRDIGQILRDAELEVPVVGAMAGVEGAFSVGSGDTFVFDEEYVYTETILMVVFHGRDLHVMTSGVPQQVFAEVCEDAARYRQFAPQALFLSVCMNRMLFFREKAHEEIDMYKSVVPEAAYMRGNSEIYMRDGAGGEMHSSLIALGMREGEGGGMP